MKKWLFLLLAFNPCARVFADETASAPSKPSPFEEDMGLIDDISGRGLFCATGRGASASSITYSGWNAPQGDTGGTGFNLLSASTVVYRSAKDIFSVYALGSDLHIVTAPQLPSGAQVPGDARTYRTGDQVQP